jgi:hypothetical protein
MQDCKVPEGMPCRRAFIFPPTLLLHAVWEERASNVSDALLQELTRRQTFLG